MGAYSLTISDKYNKALNRGGGGGGGGGAQQQVVGMYMPVGGSILTFKFSQCFALSGVVFDKISTLTVIFDSMWCFSLKIWFTF